MKSFLFWGVTQYWLVVRYRLGMAYWSQNNGNQLPSMLHNIPEEPRLPRHCCFPLACLFGWYSQMWQCFFNHSLNQVTSLSSIHFSAFVGDAVEAAWKMCGQTCRKWIYTTTTTTKKKMNFGLLKHCFQPMASWKFKKKCSKWPSSASVQDVAFLNSDWMAGKFPKCCTNHLKCFLCSLLQVLDVTDCCSINTKLYMSPEIKI